MNVKIDKFIQRNVSVDATPRNSDYISSEELDNRARRMSLDAGIHKVIITFAGGDWREYEKGKCVSSTVAEWLD